MAVCFLSSIWVTCGKASLDKGCEFGYSALGSLRTGSFFQDKTKLVGRVDKPRFVMLVGLPGSGKSRWIENARQHGWEVISIDQVRVALVEAARLRHEKIQVGGRIMDPDPQNPQHVFSFNDEAFEVGNAMVLASLARRRPVVFDATNIGPKRAIQLELARSAGYHTEAVVFETPDVAVNNVNIEQRVNQGGLDLFGVDATNPRGSRGTFLARLKTTMDSHPVRTSNSGQDWVDRVQFVGVRDWTKKSEVLRAEDRLLSRIEGAEIDPVIISRRNTGVSVRVLGEIGRSFMDNLNEVREAAAMGPLRRDGHATVTLMTAQELAELQRVFTRDTGYVLKRMAHEAGLKGTRLRGLTVLSANDGVLVDPTPFRRFREKIAELFEELRQRVGPRASYRFRAYPFNFVMR